MGKHSKFIIVVSSSIFILWIIYELVCSQILRYNKYVSLTKRKYVAIPSLISLNSSYEIWIDKGVATCLEDNYLKILMENIIENGTIYDHLTLFKNHKKPQLVQTLRNLNPRRIWNIYGVSIHPLERFLDNYFKYCSEDFLEQNKNSSICLGCKSDINCLIDKLYDRYWNLVNIKIHPEITESDNIFMPYSWRCNFKYNLKHYVKLKLEKEEEFRKEIKKLIKILRLDEEKQKYINIYLNEIFDNRTANLISNDLRIDYENEFKKNYEMCKKFISIYFYDYVNFNFKLPTF